ncbi:MAG TPA: hypothetical protein VFS52_21870 [Steroidobacteraceae bacterium]|nr:hypothetical protein [Steroidobacteraceae bacterium]
MDETTRRNAFEALMTRGHALWCRIRDITAVLKIIRFSLLVPTVLIIVLVASDQLTDILRAVGEDARRGQIASLLLAAAFEALIVWYTARTMLRFRFDSIPASQASVLPGLKRHLPRWLAVLVPTAIGVRVLLLAKGSAYPAAVYTLAAALLAIAVVVGLYVHGRRVLARMPRLDALAEQETTERRDLRSWRELPRMTRVIIVLLLLANAALMLLYVVRPIAAIGAPAILVLALGLIAVVGSTFVYMGNHYDVPVLVLLLIWVVIISPFNDNHAVRATPTMRSHGFLSRASQPVADSLPRSPLADRTLDQYFAEWWSELAAKTPGTGPVPVVLVAAEGGGIRAAYWSASVLARLEDETAGQPVPFSRHVFAISGVSGGALGGATFAAIVARRVQHPETSGRTRVAEVDDTLGRDFLSPTLATMLFPDLLQRFIPLPVFNDRAIALEKSWERAWARAHPDDAARFRHSFHDLWGIEPHAVPLLFLNSTVVETGQRAVIHPLGSYPEGQVGPLGDALDVSRILGTELPLSTAAHLSARFTYVSPAGLVDTHRAGRDRWIRLVDGGYFDNSGTATLQEIARAIRRARARLPEGQRPMRIIVLHIPNDPPNAPVPRGSVLNGRELLSESLSPVRALLATRSAHARQSIEFMKNGADDNRFTFVAATLYRSKSDLPLGWVLSEHVQDQIRDQLTTCAPATDCAARAIERIAEALR